MDYTMSNLTMDDYEETVAFWRSQNGIAFNESDEPEPMSRFLLRTPE